MVDAAAVPVRCLVVLHGRVIDSDRAEDGEDPTTDASGLKAAAAGMAMSFIFFPRLRCRLFGTPRTLTRLIWSPRLGTDSRASWASFRCRTLLPSQK